MRIPTIESVTVKDDGDDLVSVHIKFSPNSEMEVGSPTISLIGHRERVKCAFRHPPGGGARCKKCAGDTSNEADS